MLNSPLAVITVPKNNKLHLQAKIDRSKSKERLQHKETRNSGAVEATAMSLSENVQKSAFNSLASMMSKSKSHGSSSSSRASKKKRAPKPYEPIRLPKDILTIQAHSASTPVTELPYLLIAAHIGALPSTRQFYPTTTSSHTPLTVFRDMFVMTMDVRGYKPSSVRLSTEGRLIIIECLQSEVPQVEFTQTGTVDANDQCVVDPVPNISAMPVHTSFNYTQHRVKLPDEFSEEGLKVGMDDVTGHVIITGRLIHSQSAAFPEAWNNVSSKKAKGPLVNTSCSNLSKEDARKLAAWHAVQSQPQGQAEEVQSTSLLGYGRKQWLEREGAKLRAMQHKALKDNMQKLTEMKRAAEIKKKNQPPPPPPAEENIKDKPSGIPPTEKSEPSLPAAEVEKSNTEKGKTAPVVTKPKEIRPKVSFQHESNKALIVKNSSVSSGSSRGKKKSLHKFAANVNNSKHKNAKPQNQQPKKNFNLEHTPVLAKKEPTTLGLEGKPAQHSLHTSIKDNLSTSKALPDKTITVAGNAANNVALEDNSQIGATTEDNSQNATATIYDVVKQEVEDSGLGQSATISLVEQAKEAINTSVLSRDGSKSQIESGIKNIASPINRRTPKSGNSASPSPLKARTPTGGSNVSSPKISAAKLSKTNNIASKNVSKATSKVKSSYQEGVTEETELKPRMSSNAQVTRTGNRGRKTPRNEPEDGELREFADLMVTNGANNLDDEDDPVGKEDKSLWQKILIQAGAGPNDVPSDNNWKPRSRSPSPTND